MKYCNCGNETIPITTDLVFKIGEQSRVIIKCMPIYKCVGCTDYLMEDLVMERVDALLAKIDPAAELSVLLYAA